MEIQTTFWKGSFSSTQLSTLNTLLSFYHSSNPSAIVDYGDFIAAPMEEERYKWIMKNVTRPIFDTRDIFKPKSTDVPVADNNEKEPKNNSVSPILKQYLDLKAKHPDALLLFRCSDYYETYMQDAEKSSKILGITLTKSSKTKDPDGKPLAMAGFPYHALDAYLPKLIRAGHRVAICDQIEDSPKKHKVNVTVSPNISEPKTEDNEEKSIDTDTTNISNTESSDLRSELTTDNEQQIEQQSDDVSAEVETFDEAEESNQPTEETNDVAEEEPVLPETKESIIEWCVEKMTDAFIDSLVFRTPVHFENFGSEFTANAATIINDTLNFCVSCVSGKHAGESRTLKAIQFPLDNLKLFSTAIFRDVTLS